LAVEAARYRIGSAPGVAAVSRVRLCVNLRGGHARRYVPETTGAGVSLPSGSSPASSRYSATSTGRLSSTPSTASTASWASRRSHGAEDGIPTGKRTTSPGAPSSPPPRSGTASRRFGCRGRVGVVARIVGE
jgi:hypothetical protein